MDKNRISAFLVSTGIAVFSGMAIYSVFYGDGLLVMKGIIAGVAIGVLATIPQILIKDKP